MNKITEMFFWIKNKKKIQEQIEIDDKQFNNLLIQIRKKDKKIEELEKKLKEKEKC